MTLEPKFPPGRANRKALRFASDIRRLRNAGYTFSAIRRALADVGISVGLTTIKREAARRGNAPSMYSQPVGVSQDPSPTAAPTTASPDPLKPRLLVPPGASGREIAEAFFNAHPSNPLLQSEETP